MKNVIVYSKTLCRYVIRHRGTACEEILFPSIIPSVRKVNICFIRQAST